jgi:protein-S-isoprenylcysteine O-methyltransferase Ste14
MFTYILIGIQLEEKKIVAAFGNEYKIYQKKVNRLIPGLL